MEQKQMTPLLIVCIVVLSSVTLILPVYLCLFIEWTAWADSISILEINTIESVDVAILDMCIIVFSVVFYVVFYQLAIRIGIRNVRKKLLTACLGTVICAFLMLLFPLHSIFERFEMNADRQIVLITVILLVINYIIGIIYAIRHYPKVKKEKVKTD